MPGTSTTTSSTALTSNRGRTRTPAPVVEADPDDERPHADHGPDQLAPEEVPRRSVVGERRDRRRRQHHHDADDVEHRDRGRAGAVSTTRSRPSWRARAPRGGARRSSPNAAARSRSCTKPVPAGPTAERPRGRSRLPARRSSRTSRRTCTRVTTAPCRRVRARRPPPDRLADGRSLHDRHQVEEHGFDVGRSLPDRHHHAEARSVHAQLVETTGTIPPPGEEDRVVEGVQRARGGMRVRRLGVVDVVDPGSWRRAPRGAAGSPPASVAAIARGRPDLERGGGGRERVVDVVGRPETGTGSALRGPDELAPRRRSRRRRRTESERTTRPGAPGARRSRRDVGVDHEHVVGALLGEHRPSPPHRRRRCRASRGGPGHVQQHRDVGAKAAVVNSSWNVETSATTTSTSSPAASTSVGRCCPQRAREPRRSTIAAIIDVTSSCRWCRSPRRRAAQARARRRSRARSISDRTGTPASRAPRRAGCPGGTPGLGTTRSAARACATASRPSGRSTSTAHPERPLGADATHPPAWRHAADAPPRP